MKIQGLENYSYNEIIDIINDFIMDKILDSGHSADDIKLTDIRLHGSRLRGQARDDSDLDAVVEYDGDIREDDFFNILNDEDALYIDDIIVDINPIKEDLDLYMKRSNDYDRTKLDLEGINMTLEERLSRLERIVNERRRVTNEVASITSTVAPVVIKNLPPILKVLPDFIKALENDPLNKNEEVAKMLTQFGELGAKVVELFNGIKM